MIRLSTLFAASLALGASASLSASAEEASPAPSKELQTFMKGFEGKWKCDTTFPAGAFGPESPEIRTKASVTMKKDLNGFFYRGEYRTAKAKGMPSDFGGIFYMGYDPGTKQILNVSVDNTGGASLSAGPIEGNTATWTGDAYMMGMKVKVRESLSLKSAREATHKYEVDVGKGFQVMGEDICKK